MYGTGALVWAARAGCVGSVKVLVEAKADLDAPGRSGCTALEWARIKQHEDVATVLERALARRDAESAYRPPKAAAAPSHARQNAERSASPPLEDRADRASLTSEPTKSSIDATAMLQAAATATRLREQGREREALQLERLIAQSCSGLELHHHPNEHYEHRDRHDHHPLSDAFNLRAGSSEGSAGASEQPGGSITPAHQHLSPDVEAEFCAMDRNGDGVIDRDEWDEAMRGQPEATARQRLGSRGGAMQGTVARRMRQMAEGHLDDLLRGAQGLATKAGQAPSQSRERQPTSQPHHGSYAPSELSQRSSSRGRSQGTEECSREPSREPEDYAWEHQEGGHQAQEQPKYDLYGRRYKPSSYSEIYARKRSGSITSQNQGVGAVPARTRPEPELVNLHHQHGGLSEPVHYEHDEARHFQKSYAREPHEEMLVEGRSMAQKLKHLAQMRHAGML